MPVIERPIAPHRLTTAQYQAKVAKDLEYEQAVQALCKPFYAKKKTTGVTAKEQAKFDSDNATLWNNYLIWAKANSLYETVSVEKQLEEAQLVLDEQVTGVNTLKVELGLKPVEIAEKVIAVEPIAEK